MALVRLSPGVYRDSKTGKTVNSTTGKAPKGKGGMTDKPVKSAPAQDPNLNANQQQIQTQAETADIGLGGLANDQVGQVTDVYQDPFQYTGPGPASYNPEERQRIESELMGRFERYDAPQRQQENDDLARWSQSTGNSVDSPAYAAKQKQLSDSQNARALDARSQAVSQGLQDAQGQFDMSDTSFQRHYGLQTDLRDRPMNELGATRGLIQGVAPAQQFSYETQLQDQQGRIARQNARFANGLRPAGGGGGSGGGRGGMTAAPQGYTPAYMGGQPGAQQPGYGTQLANSLLPKLAGPLAEKGGSYLADQLSSLWD